jgi:hypothetical protein
MKREVAFMWALKRLGGRRGQNPRALPTGDGTAIARHLQLSLRRLS